MADDEILAAARDVLGRVGPQGLTLAAVAGEVGLRAPTVLQRFGSKRGLLLALSGRAVADIPPLFAEARRRRSALGALVAGFGQLVAGIKSPAAMGHHVAFLAMDLADPDLRRLAAAHGAALRMEIEAILRHAAATGELVGINTTGMARAVATAYHGSLVTWALDGRGSLAAWVASDIHAAMAPFLTGTHV